MNIKQAQNKLSTIHKNNYRSKILSKRRKLNDSTTQLKSNRFNSLSYGKFYDSVANKSNIVTPSGLITENSGARSASLKKHKITYPGKNIRTEEAIISSKAYIFKNDYRNFKYVQECIQ